jgi:hypothetical protein
MKKLYRNIFKNRERMRILAKCGSSFRKSLFGVNPVPSEAECGEAFFIDIT